MHHATPFLSIVLIGKIASGKGTQADAIIDKFGGNLYSNGDKVRETAGADTPFGRKMKEVYEAGLLIPEWIASYWMTHALVSQFPTEHIVFEAVAKKPLEAQQFHEMHQWLKRPYIVFNLDVPDSVVRERSAARARDGVDAPEIVERRLMQFHEFTDHSIELFRDYGTLVDIDGTQSPDVVRNIIFTHLQQS